MPSTPVPAPMPGNSAACWHHPTLLRPRGFSDYVSTLGIKTRFVTWLPPGTSSAVADFSKFRLCTSLLRILCSVSVSRLPPCHCTCSHASPNSTLCTSYFLEDGPISICKLGGFLFQTSNWLLGFQNDFTTI